MGTAGGDASWINGKNEIHNRIIHNMVREGLLYSNQHENKWYRVAETLAEVHRCRIHSALDNISPHFVWYGKNPSIHELKTFRCDIYPITSSPKKLYYRTKAESFMGYTNIRAQ